MYQILNIIIHIDSLIFYLNILPRNLRLQLHPPPQKNNIFPIPRPLHPSCRKLPATRTYRDNPTTGTAGNASPPDNADECHDDDDDYNNDDIAAGVAARTSPDCTHP